MTGYFDSCPATHITARRCHSLLYISRMSEMMQAAPRPAMDAKTFSSSVADYRKRAQIFNISF